VDGADPAICPFWAEREGKTAEIWNTPLARRAPGPFHGLVEVGGNCMTRTLLLATLSLLVGGEFAQAGLEQALETKILVKSTAAWNGRAYDKYGDGRPELTVARVTIPAHTRLPWHTHPMPNVGYILSGHITVEDRATGRKKLFRAGEAIPEQVNAAHRGSTDNEAVVILVTYAGVAGQPRSVPVGP